MTKDQTSTTVPVKLRQRLVGIVVTARPKTASVKVARRVKHPRYGKYYLRRKCYQAHDDLGVAVGDKVELCSTRPRSRHKSFVIVAKL